PGRDTTRYTGVDHPAQARSDADVIQQAVDLLPGRAHKRHLGTQTLPRSDPSGQPRLLDLQPRRIGERLENGIGRITKRDGPVEVEKDDRIWSKHEPESN